jgi:hypothetical protein
MCSLKLLLFKILNRYLTILTIQTVGASKKLERFATHFGLARSRLIRARSPSCSPSTPMTAAIANAPYALTKKLIPRVHEPSQTRASVEPSFSLAAGSTVSLARLSLRLARARFESRSRVRQVNETVEISSSAQLPLDSPVPTRFL